MEDRTIFCVLLIVITVVYMFIYIKMQGKYLKLLKKTNNEWKDLAGRQNAEWFNKCCNLIDAHKKELEKTRDETIEEYKKACMDVAFENWTRQQWKMLEMLFESIDKGFPYKCAGCEWFGRPSDAPESVPEDCMFENHGNLPCEED